jgi:hypothetical protein
LYPSLSLFLLYIFLFLSSSPARKEAPTGRRAQRPILLLEAQLLERAASERTFIEFGADSRAAKETQWHLQGCGNSASSFFLNSRFSQDPSFHDTVQAHRSVRMWQQPCLEVRGSEE